MEEGRGEARRGEAGWIRVAGKMRKEDKNETSEIRGLIYRAAERKEN